jgi:hypothetical protein
MKYRDGDMVYAAVPDGRFVLGKVVMVVPPRYYSVRFGQTDSEVRGLECWFSEVELAQDGRARIAPVDIRDRASKPLNEIFKLELPVEHDPVNHPAYYTSGAVECIDAIQAALTPEEFRGFLKG